ncbi:enoyl-CoA hydratase/isomerase [Acrodontium crateriforme]|uniref:Enoyl-CoA hydratase/isomerase n=1 Tax=Acrodontium crateriforme TaxID=150365 RepID=A0AAQ3M6I7_9PEZI|nr:enoyl-CoA hydratase/isomerase [Acrodontium crateriforme]
MTTVINIDKSLSPIYIVSINRPHRKNAVDRATAIALHDAFRQFDQDDTFSVAILQGLGNTFCAGADLKAMMQNGKRDEKTGNPMNEDMNEIAPMGCTRLQLSKPVIAAISGHAVAGGLELAIWCDLRVADSTAKFGVFCRMRGVPLIDGGTVRLPRLIGLSAASDMILTGREITADEAKQINLINYLTKSGAKNAAFDEALRVARLIASHPQTCLRNDRQSMLRNMNQHSELEMMAHEFKFGVDTLQAKGFGVDVQKFLDRSKL